MNASGCEAKPAERPALSRGVKWTIFLLALIEAGSLLVVVVRLVRSKWG